MAVMTLVVVMMVVLLVLLTVVEIGLVQEMAYLVTVVVTITNMFVGELK